MAGKFTDSIASLRDSLEGARVHAINTRPSFLPRGAGSETSLLLVFVYLLLSLQK